MGQLLALVETVVERVLSPVTADILLNESQIHLDFGLGLFNKLQNPIIKVCRVFQLWFKVFKAIINPIILIPVLIEFDQTVGVLEKLLVHFLHLSTILFNELFERTVAVAVELYYD